MVENKRIVIFGWAGSVHIKRWAKGLVDRGYQVKVISLGFSPIDDIETVVFPRKNGWSYYRYAAQAVREAKKFKPHLIHAHYSFGFGWWALRANFKPSLVSVWGSDITGRAKNPFYRFIIKKILKKATYVTATSEFLKKETLKLAPFVIDKVKITPFGVDVPDVFLPLPISPPIKICFIKNHRLIYGPDIILKALVKVKKHIPDIELSIAGEGEATPMIKKMVQELQLEKNVKLVGFVKNDEITSFIQQHHFMVMPSRQESFGVAALEAQASGRAVIASDVGGIPEVLVDGKTGILFPKGDIDRLAQAILKLANDYDLMQKMGKAGYEFVKENYSWEKSLDIMTQLYENLINEKS